MTIIVDTPKVEFHGVEYPILFGGYVLGEFFKKHKIDLDTFNEVILKDYLLLYELIYDAVKFAHMGLGKEFAYTLIQFSFIIDADKDGLNKCITAFLESQGGDQDNTDTDTEKKTEAQ